MKLLATINIFENKDAEKKDLGGPQEFPYEIELCVANTNKSCKYSLASYDSSILTLMNDCMEIIEWYSKKDLPFFTIGKTPSLMFFGKKIERIKNDPRH